MVEWKKLGDISNNLDFKRKPITSSKRVTGIYPYYGASGIVDYVDSYIFDGEYLLVSEDGANLIARTMPIAFSIKGKNWVNNHAHVLEFRNKITQSYIEKYLNMIDLSPWINGAAQPKLTQANLSLIGIPIPSISEQERIVDILDTFTSSIENLKQQIAQRRKQYEYYRDQLLDLEGKEGVEMNSVAHFVKERILANELTAQNYTSVENLLKDKAGRKDAENVPSEGNWIKYQKGDVLIGNIRPYLRKIWLSDREGGTNGDVIVIRAKEVLLPEFMFYCLASESFFIYYNQALKDGKMPRGEKNRVLSYIIPFIRKEEQQRIVSILDTFEASIQNLEAQLSQREKQYEYYRNKLLTFE